jgi:hypothetical protein
LIAAVEARSNSRISDSTSCEAVTKSFGQIFRTAASAAFSFSAFA